MDREKLFEAYLKECKEHGEICGQGNPLAKILIVAKEPHDPELQGKELMDYISKKWERCRINNPERRKDLVTWGFYQELIEKVYKEEYQNNIHDKTVFDFEEYAYTTELSSEPRLRSNYSKAKKNIYKRLKHFSESDFIKDFPVVILACGGYIRNDDRVRQIDDTFCVEFTKREDISKNNWICTHYNKKDRQKQLVIHTRQLSRDVNPELLCRIAEIIREHLNIK